MWKAKYERAEYLGCTWPSLHPAFVQADLKGARAKGAPARRFFDRGDLKEWAIVVIADAYFGVVISYRKRAVAAVFDVQDAVHHFTPFRH